MVFLLVIGVIICGPAHAWEPDPWSKEDILFEILSITARMADWSTTLDCADNPDDCDCANPLQGDDPGRAKLNVYFASEILLHPVIVYILPKECELFGFKFQPRRTFQVFTISASLAFVHSNRAAGLRFRF